MGTFKMEYSLNVCDIFSVLMRKYSSVENIITTAEEKTNQKYERLYLGAYFCDLFFIKNIKNILVEAYPCCKDNNIMINLVLPVFSESNLSGGKSAIHEVLHMYADVIDELTINDFGMLSYISERTSLDIFLGRLIQKYARDIRYPDYSKSTFEFYGYDDLYEEICKGIEFDICAEKMKIRLGGKKVVVHRKYAYATTGRNCYFAGVNKSIWSKLSDMNHCDEMCNKFFVKSTDKGHNSYYRIGKAVYFEMPSAKIESEGTIRFVDLPVNLWMEKYPPTDMIL